MSLDIDDHCAPADLRHVDGELATLPPWSPSPWVGRYVPTGVMAVFRGQANTAAPGALDIGSVVVTDVETGDMLRRDVDYDIAADYGSICLPEGTASAGRRVRLSYTFSLLRLDSVAVDEGGAEVYVTAQPALATPHPPTLGPGLRRVANVLVPYFGTAGDASVWPVGERAADAELLTGQLPNARRTLAETNELTILFLGDSVTQGAEATTESSTFRAVAVELVRERMPDATIHAAIAAVGGSNSSDWLGDDPTWDWGLVESSGAQVAVLEFVNDSGKDRATLVANYSEIVDRLTAIGCELVLTTPAYTMPAMMADPLGLGVDNRPYVAFIRDFAAQRGIPLADVSRAWQGLRSEGLPYWTLLANGINHPDDRGHELGGRVIADRLVSLLLG